MAFFFDVFGTLYSHAREINECRNENELSEQLVELKGIEKESKEHNDADGYIRLFLLAFVYA